MYATLLGVCTMFLSSCGDDDAPENTQFGTVTGTVSDEEGAGISDVEVTITGINEDDIMTTTDANGKYSVDGVSMKTHAVKFAKEGWLTISVTVNADKFSAEGVAIADVSMINASAKIMGTVIDAKNGGVPLAGVTINTGIADMETLTTDAEGKFLIENLVEGDYSLQFSKANYVSVTKSVTSASFIDGVATISIQMGASEILRGLTAEDLQDADKWYYNEYRGGGNADAYPHWDWACDYMSTLTFWGNWEEQWEGTTLRIRNDEGDRSNPADLNVFDSYTYGSKKITEDNKIFSIRLRTHDADAGAPAVFGVQVVDLSEAEPQAVKIGGNQTYGSGDYTDFFFDLSDYVGKEVIIAVGIYRQSTGDYWKQLVLRAMRFADQEVRNWDWLPGTEVVSGWKLTQETVRSTMAQTKTSFTGMNSITPSRNVSMTDGYPAAYQAWKENSHIGAEWFFAPLKKDPEVDKTEGFILKTRGTPEVNTVVPEAYIYAKFPIAAGTNQLTLSTRNFGDNLTYFKLTAIQNDGTVTHIEPSSNTAQEASAAEDGCWKFKHGDGGAGNPEGYALFNYDLSQFNGEEVTLVFGVYNGVANSGENKLVFHTIDLN